MSLSDTPISQKILFVDDEELLLEGIKRQLRREFDISIANSGEAGLKLLAEEGPFALVVSDYNMPGMDGIAFLNNVYQRHPHTVLIMLTGRAELDIAVNALHNAHISRFLNKPCPKEILQETLADGLEQYRLRKSEQLLQARLQEANHSLNQLNNHLEALVEEKTKALRLQYAYAAQMTQLQDSSAIVLSFVETLGELLGNTQINLWLSPLHDGLFSCHYPQGNNLPAFPANNSNDTPILAALQTQTYWMLGNADPVSDTTGLERQLFSGEPLFCMPLKVKQGILGLLAISGSIAITKEQLETISGIADVTATALQNQWHREAHDDAQDAIISALAKLSEYRDPETGAHLLRLKKYCELLCSYLGKTGQFAGLVTAEFTKDLVRSSPLHDIGKVGIPDAILKKPGKLTEEEFEVMKTHAAIGGDTLRAVYENYPSQGFIKCGMDIAYGHHEKWNGSGYPLGLKGEEIPLVARILALVDVYDALSCRRIYKPPFPREKAREIIVEGSGNHFDPQLVSAFLSIEEDFFRISEEYADQF